MVQIKEITKQEFLELYINAEVTDIITIEINGEQRIYGRTRINAAFEEKGYIVVYVVI